MPQHLAHGRSESTFTFLAAPPRASTGRNMEDMVVQGPWRRGAADSDSGMQMCGALEAHSAELGPTGGARGLQEVLHLPCFA